MKARAGTAPFASARDALFWAVRPSLAPESARRARGEPRRAVTPSVVLGLALQTCRDDRELGAALRFAITNATRVSPDPTPPKLQAALDELADALWSYHALDTPADEPVAGGGT